jgi:hypothetical protein
MKKKEKNIELTRIIHKFTHTLGKLMDDEEEQIMDEKEEKI